MSGEVAPSEVNIRMTDSLFAAKKGITATPLALGTSRRGVHLAEADYAVAVNACNKLPMHLVLAIAIELFRRNLRVLKKRPKIDFQSLFGPGTITTYKHHDKCSMNISSISMLLTLTEPLT